MTPDLTALGKIIGGGLPIGAVCGKRDVMERMDDIMHSGSEYAYSEGPPGNVLSFAAGLAAIQIPPRTPPPVMAAPATPSVAPLSSSPMIGVGTVTRTCTC